MIAALILLIIGMAAVWIVSTQRLRQEISEQKKALKSLRETSGGLQESLDMRGKRLDVLLSSISEAVLRVDMLGRVLAANPRAVELFSMKKTLELPQSMLVFLRDPDWHRVFLAALKRKQEVTLPDVSMGGRVLSPRLALLVDDQALLLCMDVTERERQERRQRQLLSNIQHDLKTPLTSLLGYARSLESFGHDEAFRQEAAKVIGDEAQHVNRLLDALLTLDEIDSMRRDDVQGCSAPEIFSQCKSVMLPAMHGRKIRMDIVGAESLPDVAMAAHDLERVFTNILENAMRYTPDDSTLHVRFSQVNSDIEIVIEDEGPGIPEKDLERVTERFYRVDRSRKRRKDGGHGLGLAIVREMVEVHDGAVELKNREQGGLAVTIRLPVDDNES